MDKTYHDHKLRNFQKNNYQNKSSNDYRHQNPNNCQQFRNNEYRLQNPNNSGQYRNNNNYNTFRPNNHSAQMRNQDHYNSGQTRQNNNNYGNYEKMPSDKIRIHTIEGKVNKQTEGVKTHCPKEFNQPTNARIKWIKIKLEKNYDFLLGMDWIENNVKKNRH